LQILLQDKYNIGVLTVNIEFMWLDSSIPLEVKDLNLFLLMYADDMVIFSESISGLQNMLDALYEYTS
jgi:hypothetical protein